LLRSHLLEGEVAVDDTKDVHLLTLVLVDTLDLNVEESVGIDGDTGGVLDESGETNLVGELDVLPLVDKICVVGVLLEVLEERGVFEEIIASEDMSNVVRELGIALVEPATGGDAVGDVGEAVWAAYLHEVFEDGGLDEVRVKFSDTVDLVRTDDGEVGHTDDLWLGLLNNRDTGEKLAILGELLLDGLEEEQVNVVDDLQVTRKQVLDKWNRPLLQSLRKDGMVGVRKDTSNNIPSNIPLKLLDIDQDSLQFRNGKSRMGIVKLDSNLIWELRPWSVSLLETTDNIVEGCSNPEILLLETKLLSAVDVIVGV
jgi:hypothetical protein